MVNHSEPHDTNDFEFFQPSAIFRTNEFAFIWPLEHAQYFMSYALLGGLVSGSLRSVLSRPAGTFSAWFWTRWVPSVGRWDRTGLA